MEQEMPIGVRVAILDRAFRRQMDEHARNLGLTGVQVGVLAALTRLEREGQGEINQRALEQATRVTHPTMTEILKRLEKNGFLECRGSTVDRRQKAVVSTALTREFIENTREWDGEVFRRLCRGLTQEEAEEFLRILRVMLENVGPCREKGCELPGKEEKSK